MRHVEWIKNDWTENSARLRRKFSCRREEDQLRMCRSVARRLVRQEETETSEHMMTVQCKQKNAYENLSGCGREFKEILRIQRSHKSLFHCHQVCIIDCPLNRAERLKPFRLIGSPRHGAESSASYDENRAAIVRKSDYWRSFSPILPDGFYANIFKLNIHDVAFHLRFIIFIAAQLLPRNKLISGPLTSDPTW